MSLPNISVDIRPDSSFIVGGTAVLGTTALGSGFLLGPAAAAMVSIGSTVTDVSIRRGRTRVTESFDTGSATVRLVDTTGRFNPDNTSSDLYPYVLPLRQFRISAIVNGVSVQLFNGYTTRYTYDYDPGVNATYVTIEAEDAFRLLSLADITTVTGAVTGEQTGTRIDRILTDLGVPNSITNISTGVSPCDADPDVTRSGLEAIQQVENTELGAFYIDADGNHTFKSRHEIQQLAAGITVTPLVFNETSGLDYVAVRIGLDDQQVYNSVTISGAAIIEQSVVDTTSSDEYFLRSLVRSDLLITTDTEALDQANLLLSSRKNPTLTIDSIAIKPLALSDADAYSVVSTDLLEPITITKSYLGSTLTRTLTVQGIEHSINAGDWSMGIALAEPIGGDALVLDSTNQGLLDVDLVSY